MDNEKHSPEERAQKRAVEIVGICKDLGGTCFYIAEHFDFDMVISELKKISEVEVIKIIRENRQVVVFLKQKS